jgi:predicted RNA-binding Zn ribbon-like protein
MEQVPHFELDSGVLCLDFANTIGRRKEDPPRGEDLNRYADLIAFGQQTGVLTDEAAAQLWDEATRQPAEAERAFIAAISFREAIYRIFSGIAAGREADPDDLAAVNARFAEAVGRARIVPDGDGFRWEWPEEPGALLAMLWPIAWSTAELLQKPETLRRVRECASDSCSWLFLDMSKNGSRRWCSMESCGNRAKAQRHRTRQRHHQHAA